MTSCGEILISIVRPLIRIAPGALIAHTGERSVFAVIGDMRVFCRARSCCPGIEATAVDMADSIDYGLTADERTMIAVMLQRMAGQVITSRPAKLSRRQRTRQELLLTYIDVMLRAAHELFTRQPWPAPVSDGQAADWKWFTRIRGRICYTVTGRRADGQQHTFGAGTELELIQYGEEGKPVNSSYWQTSYDVGASYAIPAEAVETAEVLARQAPFRGLGLTLP